MVKTFKVGEVQDGSSEFRFRQRGVWRTWEEPGRSYSLGRGG